MYTDSSLKEVWFVLLFRL